MCRCYYDIVDDNYKNNVSKSRESDIIKEHFGLRVNSNKEKTNFRSIEQLNYKKDLKQFEKYKEILGEDAPKTLDDFQALKYNNVKEWSTMKDYYKARVKGNISSFSTFQDYKDVRGEIEHKIIGKVTKDGIEIKSYSKHMIDRILGTSNDPKSGRSRSGTTVDGVLDALINPIDIEKTKSRQLEKVAEISKKYIGESTTVSINPVTGNLIQSNPTDVDKVRRLRKKNEKTN